MGEVKLLAGGNPQIPKGDGLEPVRAYLTAMPGWKGEIGRRLHEALDEAQLRDWIRQALALPGDPMF